MTPDLLHSLLEVILSVCGAVGVYAGIKSDLAVTRYKAELAQSLAEDAHRRLNAFFQPRIPK